MKTYQFTCDDDVLVYIYEAIGDKITDLGLANDADYDDAIDQLESLTFKDVTPTDWATTAADLASGDLRRIEPHLPCPDCPHSLGDHDEQGCNHHLPLARNIVCVCTTGVTREAGQPST